MGIITWQHKAYFRSYILSYEDEQGVCGKGVRWLSINKALTYYAIYFQSLLDFLIHRSAKFWSVLCAELN